MEQVLVDNRKRYFSFLFFECYNLIGDSMKIIDNLKKKKVNKNTKETVGVISKRNVISYNPLKYRYYYKYKVYDLWYEVLDSKTYSNEIVLGTKVKVYYNSDNPSTSFIVL